MKTPSAQMKNKGVSSYEHMQGTAKRAHEGSQSTPPMSEKGENAGLGSSTAAGGVHNLGM
jgi:hypothetical protein